MSSHKQTRVPLGFDDSDEEDDTKVPELVVPGTEEEPMDVTFRRLLVYNPGVNTMSTSLNTLEEIDAFIAKAASTPALQDSCRQLRTLRLSLQTYITDNYEDLLAGCDPSTHVRPNNRPAPSASFTLSELDRARNDLQMWNKMLRSHPDQKETYMALRNSAEARVRHLVEEDRRLCLFAKDSATAAHSPPHFVRSLSLEPVPERYDADGFVDPGSAHTPENNRIPSPVATSTTDIIPNITTGILVTLQDKFLGFEPDETTLSSLAITATQTGFVELPEWARLKCLPYGSMTWKQVIYALSDEEKTVLDIDDMTAFLARVLTPEEVVRGLSSLPDITAVFVVRHSSTLRNILAVAQKEQNTVFANLPTTIQSMFI